MLVDDSCAGPGSEAAGPGRKSALTCLGQAWCWAEASGHRGAASSLAIAWHSEVPTGAVTRRRRTLENQGSLPLSFEMRCCRQSSCDCEICCFELVWPGQRWAFWVAHSRCSGNSQWMRSKQWPKGAPIRNQAFILWSLSVFISVFPLCLVDLDVHCQCQPILFVSLWISFWYSEASSFDGEAVSLFLSVFWIAFRFSFQSLNKYSICFFLMIWFLYL